MIDRLVPPFKIRRQNEQVAIDDSEGSLCICDNIEVAHLIFDALNHLYRWGHFEEKRDDEGES